MKPVAILLHGGGLSSWSLKPLAEILSQKFQVVMPDIDGHGENSGKDFISIYRSAQEVVKLIKDNYGGKVGLLYGLSLGAQIVCECLSADENITECAIIESALVKPSRIMASLIPFLYKIFFPLIKIRRFSDYQAKALCLPKDMYKPYYRDVSRMSKNTLINIGTSNMSFSLSPKISETKARVLIVCGSREIQSIKASARLIKKHIKDSELFIAQSCKHGEFSLRNSKMCAETYLSFCLRSV